MATLQRPKNAERSAPAPPQVKAEARQPAVAATNAQRSQQAAPQAAAPAGMVWPAAMYAQPGATAAAFYPQAYPQMAYGYVQPVYGAWASGALW